MCSNKEECRITNRNGCRDFIPKNSEEFMSSVLEDLKNTVKNKNYTSYIRATPGDAFDAIVKDAAVCINNDRTAYLFTLDQVCHLFEWQNVDIDSVNVFWNVREGVFTVSRKERWDFGWI